MKPASFDTLGFTLIELMVVLAILAILAMLAAPSFQRTITQQRISSLASELLVSTMQARGEAIKNNQPTIIDPVLNTDWSRGWRIYVDSDGDGAYTAGTDTLITTVPAAAENIVQDAAVFAGANRIGFSATGFLLNSNAGRVVFAANPSIDLKKGLKISRIGRPRVCTSKPGTGNDGCAASAD